MKSIGFIYAYEKEGKWHAAIEPWEGMSWFGTDLQVVLDRARQYLEAKNAQGRVVGDSGSEV